MDERLNQVINPLFAAKQTAVLIFGCYVASLIYNVLSMLHLGRTRSYIGMFMATLPAWRCGSGTGQIHPRMFGEDESMLKSPTLDEVTWGLTWMLFFFVL